MKTKTILLISIICSIFSACSKDDNSNNGNYLPDPEGTITINMKNDGSDFIEGVRLVSSNNFYQFNGEIASVGKVNGLGAITKIPSGTVFIDEVAVEIGHGYIWRNLSGDGYCRVYVCKWLTNTSREIIGIQAKYQNPFYPEE